MLAAKNKSKFSSQLDSISAIFWDTLLTELTELMPHIFNLYKLILIHFDLFKLIFSDQQVGFFEIPVVMSQLFGMQTLSYFISG